MTDEQIQKIIDALLNATFLDDWYFYVILFSVSLLGGLVGAYLKSYGAEKAKYTAIESSLETIEKQIKLTTKTSETIKTTLDHENWRKKELEVLKRQKIEEYFSLVLIIHESLQDEMMHIYYKNEPKFDHQTYNKATVIQALHLPEIEKEHLGLAQAVIDFQTWVFTGRKIANNQKKIGLPQTPTKGHMKEQSPLIRKVGDERIKVLNKIRDIAQQLNN